MFSDSEYELLDFGDGRKLERFGELILDRPSPSAETSSPANPTAWSDATLCYERTSRTTGKWSPQRAVRKSWPLHFAPKQSSRFQFPPFQFELRLTDFGHVGVFPEQTSNWAWIQKQVAKSDRQLKVLNLFAYTGGSTMAAAAAGASVTHIDAAKNVVDWARKNAELSGLSESPIRWIAEDAQRFVDRELKRGNQYDAVILDPPSYGHGPKGEVWKMSDHIFPLLRCCAKLTSESRAFVLFSCHTPGFGPAEVEAMLADAFFGHCQAGARASKLTVTTKSGRALSSGVVARWP
ncbi:MAG: 23S rRNA (cytosine1962-C5)-methyltransferase [Pirellulaceae bacterium]|jgi:23S rRNA (cytosine1962-C5)-methyltransferase